MPAGPTTIVFLHAHPDDEALFTAGTMARAVADGHRVVLVVATEGGAGLAAGGFLEQEGGLAAVRARELAASAAVLGVSRLVRLGYADSGLHGDAEAAPGGPVPFVQVPAAEAARALAEVLREEDAGVLTTYDPAGGYGHPDHLRVHEVGALAASLAGTPVVLEATVPRDAMARLARWVARVPGVPSSFDPSSFTRAFVPRGEITHTVDVRDVIGAKRASMAAHASQATADDGPRTLAALLRLPRPLYRRVLGREWYVHRPAGDVPPPPLFAPTTT